MSSYSTESSAVALTTTLGCVGVVDVPVGSPSPRELPGELNKVKLLSRFPENPFPPENPFSECRVD